MLLSTSVTHWLHWDSWISALLKLLFNENRLPFCISTCICFPILTFLYSLIVNLYRLPLSCKSTLHAFFICLLDKLPLRVVLDLNSSTADCKIFQCRKASKEVGLGEKKEDLRKRFLFSTEDFQEHKVRKLPRRQLGRFKETAHNFLNRLSVDRWKQVF